jgi:fructose-bisphosphate aldolase class II
MRERTRRLDLERISRIRDTVPVPLVLHGSSGVPDDELVRAIEAGMTKINIATHLNIIFTRSLRGFLDADPASVETRHYLAAARDGLSAEVSRLLELLNA